jgi:hypothetical protein
VKVGSDKKKKKKDAWNEDSSGEEEEEEEDVGMELTKTYKSSANASSKWLLNPNEMQRWDATVTLALVFTGLFTPFEVAFVEGKCTHPTFVVDPLFALNRMVDLIFLCDMVLQFFLMREVETPQGTMMIKEHKLLAQYYLAGVKLLCPSSIVQRRSNQKR